MINDPYIPVVSYPHQIFMKAAKKSIDGLQFHTSFYPFLGSKQSLLEAKGKEAFDEITYKLGHQLLGCLVADLFKGCSCPNLFAKFPLGNSEYSGNHFGSQLLK